MGGLGNQIFQIFTTISYAIQSRNQFKFTNAETLGQGTTTIRSTFWGTFFARLKSFTTDKLNVSHIIREKEFIFNELPISEMTNNDVMIYGYFQSYKYFQSNYSTICRLIGLENMKTELLSKMNYDKQFLENVISIHFRLGDYKKIQHYHNILSNDYYKRSLKYIKNNSPNIHYTVMYFCEDEDIQEVMEKIEYLTNQFPLYTFIRGEKQLEDWQQLILMSCCHHNIIANSTFSWWGAYFNNWDDKIVCYPSEWFGPSSNHNTKDLFPEEWICIRN